MCVFLSVSVSRPWLQDLPIFTKHRIDVMLFDDTLTPYLFCNLKSGETKATVLDPEMVHGSRPWENIQLFGGKPFVKRRIKRCQQSDKNVFKFRFRVAGS